MPTPEIMNQIFVIMSWIYSLAWCMSFYGQIIVNHKLKSVEGMNLNFTAVNLNGFIFYSIFSCYGYFINSDQTGQVEMADLFFAIHALLATLFTTIQAIAYPKGSNKLSQSIIFFLGGQWIFLIIYYLLISNQMIEVNDKFSYISMMGYFKLMCSLLKYVPQLLWNRARRTTIGWSISSVMMDLTGGIFSVLQTILQQIYISQFEVNITKLLLGSLTIIYDLMFVYQHFILYPSVIKEAQNFQIAEQDSPSTSKIDKQIN